MIKRFVTGMTKTVPLILVLAAAALAMLVCSVTRPTTLNNAELRELGVFLFPAAREIVPFTLTTAGGETFGLAGLRGHWSFVFFGFTNCPDICPTTLAVMAEAERQLTDGVGFHGIMVSVDPGRDEPAVLDAYVGAFSPTFTGVTGSRQELVGFAQQVNVAFVRVPSADGGYSVDHSGQIVIINPQGQYHGFIKMPHMAETVVQTFRALDAAF